MVDSQMQRFGQSYHPITCGLQQILLAKPMLGCAMTARLIQSDAAIQSEKVQSAT